MKVAVTDYTFDTLDVERAILEPMGCKVVGPYAKDEPGSLLTLVADADCVITQFAPVDARVIEAMGRARAIVRYGIGVDNVDLDAARDRGIPVCNVPDYCIDEVADHTLGLILALSRQLIPHRDMVRGGRWKSGAPLHALHALKALTVGIVGFGRIGRAVAERLRPFRCMTIVADPMVPQDQIERTGCMPVTLDQMLRTADVITLHCPSLPATRGMIDAAAFRMMKPGAVFINVARGDLVDTKALIDALQSGRLGGAGLDVCDPEPVPPDSSLLGMDNVILTPHVASASVPAVTKLRTSASLTAAKAVRGEPVPNVVNGVGS
jgi:D-3-phosphoglycerate dehydrogenase / 2-oxoglutarate reductase